MIYACTRLAVALPFYFWPFPPFVPTWIDVSGTYVRYVSIFQSFLHIFWSGATLVATPVDIPLAYWKYH